MIKIKRSDILLPGADLSNRKIDMNDPWVKQVIATRKAAQAKTSHQQKKK